MKTKRKLRELPLSDLVDLGQSHMDMAREDLVGAAHDLSDLGLSRQVDAQLTEIKLKLKK